MRGQIRHGLRVWLLIAAAFPYAWYLTLSVVLQDTKYSHFYRLNHTDAVLTERLRLHHAAGYISALRDVRGRTDPATTSPRFLDAKGGAGNPDLCLVILSGVPRPQRYVETAVGFLVGRVLRELDPALHRTVQLRQAEAEDRPPPALDGTRYPKLEPTPYVRAWVHNSVGNVDHLGSVADVMEVHNTRVGQGPKPGESLVYGGWLSKAVEDYADALDRALTMRCGKTVILEDDGIVANRFLSSLLNGLKPLDEQCDWAFVKLFYTEHWAGWQSIPSDIVTLIALGVMAGFAAVTIAYHFFLRKPTTDYHSLTPSLSSPIPWHRSPLRQRSPCRIISLILLFLYAATMTSLTFHAIGRQNLTAWYNRRPGLYPTLALASTVAHVYHTVPPDTCGYNTALELVRFIRSYGRKRKEDEAVTPIDLLIDRFVEETGTTKWELMPHLVQHVGAWSSAKEKIQGHYLSMKISSSFQGDTISI
ncbi:hypothetical protein HKX48_004195 [Thoreauomyces humboldtii]|nr:hypothetical protein HKX48_004195 [Thoreauomyces humboldtii]